MDIKQAYCTIGHGMYGELEGKHQPCMQDGSFSYPADGSDYKYLLELRAEAEYYGLTGLVETIDHYPVSHAQEVATAY